MISEELRRLKSTLEQSDIDPTQIDMITIYLYLGLKEQRKHNEQLQNLQFQQQNQSTKLIQEEQQEINKQNQFENLGGEQDNLIQNFGSKPNEEGIQKIEIEINHGSGSELDSEEDSEQAQEIQPQQGEALNTNNNFLDNFNKEYLRLKSTFIGELFVTLIICSICCVLLFFQGDSCPKFDEKQK